MFSALNIDDDMQSVYWQLLRTPRTSPATLAGRLGITETKVELSLAALQKMGLVRPSLETMEVMVAISPQVGFGAVIASSKADLAQRNSDLAACETAVAALVAEHAQLTPSNAEGVQRLVGIDAIRDRIDEIAWATEYELLAFAPDGPQSAATITTSKPLDEQMLKRGVIMRSVFLDSIRNDVATVRWAQWLDEQGGEVRSAPALPLRLKIYDRRVAIVPVNPERSGAEAVEIQIPGVITALLALFDCVWRAARPLSHVYRRNEVASDQERELLRLLTLGHTDEGVARSLGVSVRTVRRMLADLMKRLGAHSRFHAGVRAAELGWVRSSESW